MLMIDYQGIIKSHVAFLCMSSEVDFPFYRGIDLGFLFQTTEPLLRHI